MPGVSDHNLAVSSLSNVERLSKENLLGDDREKGDNKSRGLGHCVEIRQGEREMRW